MSALLEDISEKQQRGRPRAFSEEGLHTILGTGERTGRLPAPSVAELTDALLKTLDDYQAVHSAMSYREARDGLRQAQQAVAVARKTKIRQAATRKVA